VAFLFVTAQGALGHVIEARALLARPALQAPSCKAKCRHRLPDHQAQKSRPPGGFPVNG
jgi:hypothetical protein